jgi:hypothetical protein
MGTRAELIAALERAGVERCLLSAPGGGWALVVPALAARVLGAGVGESNAFWVSPDLERCLQGADWNAGGERTWLAPELGPGGFFGSGEKDWAVPPALDPGAYRLLECGASTARCGSECRLRPADGAEYRLRLQRQIEIGSPPDLPPGARGVDLRIRHSLGNAGRRPICARVGLWSILQLPSLPEGELSLPDIPYRLRFGALPAGWARREAGRLALRTLPARRWKVGQPPSGPEAVIAHRRPAPLGEVRITMRCAAVLEGPYLDGGDILQTYNSPLSGEEAFCELECHAPAPTLAPGEPGSASGQEASQEVRIEVRYEE